ncbi:MAG: hypothetical protein HQ565_05060 [Bacteroidetes bacterium]|nr:hypothetical protein [Bacteroidota bacterium]
MSKFWVNTFEVVGIIPGKIFLPGHGTLDLSDEKLPFEKVKKAFDLGCPYLKLKDVKESKKDSNVSPESEGDHIVKEAINDVLEKLNDIGSKPIKEKKTTSQKKPS